MYIIFEVFFLWNLIMKWIFFNLWKIKWCIFLCLKIIGEIFIVSLIDVDVMIGLFNLIIVVCNSLENIIVNGIMYLDLLFVFWIKKW